MRHKKAGRKFKRSPEHRRMLLRNLATSLLEHGKIKTTLPKAKALRPFFEKLVTLARKGDLHARRMAASKLGPSADAEVKPGDESDADHRTVLQKLFQDLGPRFKDRPGGYTRIIKRHERRLGDAGATAYIELLPAGEVRTKRRKEAAPAPAPQIKVESAEKPAEAQPASDEAKS